MTATTMTASPTGRRPAIPPQAMSWVAPIVVLALWEIAGRTVLVGTYTVPPPSAILVKFFQDIPFALPNLMTTATEAALGWFWGNLIAVVFAAIFILVPFTHVLLFRVFVALYCLPVVALAPILAAVLPPGQAQIVIAAQAVFFTTMISVILGLQSASKTSLDLVTVSGGGRLRQLWMVRTHQALPALFSGLRIAAPAAVLGAVIGEYIGAARGLGVAMVYSQQSLDVERTWSLALYTTLLAAAFYVLTVLAERVFVPWMAHTTGIQALPAPVQHSGGWLRRTLAVTGGAVLSVVTLIAVWWLAVELSGLSSYFMKTPADVFTYLFVDEDAAMHRDVLFASLGITLRDTVLGYIAGTVAAVALAVLMSVSVGARRVITPFAIAMRAIPLVAMTPLFVLIFGRGLGVVVFIAGLVTFFPTLIQVSTAMARTPRAARDLVETSGGGPFKAATLVMLPTALPAILAAARVAAPTAMLGALLAEWLATGEGLGSDLLRASAEAGFLFIWSGVAAITLSAFALYGLATAAESWSLRRLGG